MGQKKEEEEEEACGGEMEKQGQSIKTDEDNIEKEIQKQKRWRVRVERWGFGSERGKRQRKYYRFNNEWVSVFSVKGRSLLGFTG